jgi:opacity protein-like surface antigen
MSDVEFPTSHQDRIHMKKIVLAALMTAAVGGASAQAYVGGAYGQTHVNVDCSAATSCGNNNGGYKAYVGFLINSYAAVEVGYANFGHVTYSTPVYQASSDGRIKSEAVFAVGAFRWAFVPDLPQLVGVGRIGLAKVHSNFTLGDAHLTDSGQSSKLIYGLGLEFAVTKNVKASLDADFTQTAEIPTGANVTLGSGSVRMLSLGAQYQF